MTTNPTPADHATKPSERILARARIIACYPATLNETPPDKYTLRALLEYIDEQAASASPAAPPSGEVAAPSPVEPEEPNEAVLQWGDATGHDGAGWYYWDAEYQDEGSIGAFTTRREAEAHARDAGYNKFRLKGDRISTGAHIAVEPAPQAEAAPPEPVPQRATSAATDDEPDEERSDFADGPMVLDCFHFLLPDGTCKYCKRNILAEAAAAPPDDVIRAAEGVTLEPGEYEVVEIDDIEPNLKPGDRARPEPLACMRRLSSAYDNRYGWLFLDGGPSTWVTAVRRVPLTEPEPVPESGKTLPEESLEAKHHDEHHAAEELATKERDELRSKVSELEAANAELSRKNIALFDEKEKLRSTLTATEAKLAESKGDCNELRAGLRMHETDSKLQEAELARVRGELAAVKSDYDNVHRSVFGSPAFPADTPAVAAPAVVQREIVKGSTWKQDLPPAMRVRVTIADADSIEFRWAATGVVESCPVKEFRLWFAHVSDPPAPPTAIPRGTTLEVGRWYRITEISRDDPRPAHGVGDVLQCVLRSDFGMPPGTVSAEPISIGGSTPWFAKAIDGGTYVTGLELVPGPVKEQA